MQSKLHQPFFLYHIDQFIADDFLCGVADVVHPRDLVLIYALDRNQSVIEANNKLKELGLDELPLP